jgi:hypothetical protein
MRSPNLFSISWMYLGVYFHFYGCIWGGIFNFVDVF